MEDTGKLINGIWTRLSNYSEESPINPGSLEFVVLRKRSGIQWKDDQDSKSVRVALTPTIKDAERRIVNDVFKMRTVHPDLKMNVKHSGTATHWFVMVGSPLFSIYYTVLSKTKADRWKF